MDPLIFWEKIGEKSFNLDVPDRNNCMKALFEDGNYDPKPDDPASVYTLAARCDELNSLCPDELRADALPFFIDWLKDRVQLVQITAYSDDDAYAIFETSNDRGLKLSPADMLKGYLLANIEDGTRRTKANDLWRTPPRARRKGRRGELRFPQNLAAQSILDKDARAEEGRTSGGLGPHWHRVPPVGARQP